MKIRFALFTFIVLLNACNFEQEILENPEVQSQLNQVQKEMTVAQFNYTIALIELHETRYGTYPESLDSLTFLNIWDNTSRFDYRKVSNGYILNAIADSINLGSFTDINMKDIILPDEFWNGLGITESNLKSQS